MNKRCVFPLSVERGSDKCRMGAHNTFRRKAAARVHTGSYWNAPDDLWRLVVGKEGGVLCPPCFTAEARAKGIHVSWRAVEETAA